MKTEKHIFFESEGILLEGLFFEGTQKEGVVVTHPHSLYGGSMSNTVVETICSVYQHNGMSSLRFNFRGVGNSGGEYGGGIGEQQDVLAAISYMQLRGVSSIFLAGYSFGSWVIAHTPFNESDIQSIVMVSPPAAFMKFDPNLSMRSLNLVVTGSLDDIAPKAEIEQLLPLWNTKATFEVIIGADHFYSGYQKELADVLSRNIRRTINP